MQTVRELLTRTFPPQPFFINDGIMRLNSMMVIGGAPKSYKSFIQQAVALALGTNRPLFEAWRRKHGRQESAFTTSRPCRVLFLDQELGDYDLLERFRPLIHSLPPDQAQMFVDNVFTHSLDADLQLDSKLGMERIEQLVAEAKPDVLILDPLVEFHTSDENSTQAMASVMRNLSILRQRHNLCVSVSHHCGKPNDFSSRSGPDLLRGNSVIYGKGDAFLMVSVNNRSAGILRIDPTIRRGAPIHPFFVAVDWTDLRVKFHAWATKDSVAKLTKKAGADLLDETEQ